MAQLASSRIRILGGLALGILASSSACGGGSSPTSPSGGGGGVTVISRDGGTGGQNAATVTITSAGVNPSAVTVAVGQSVTFTNSDSRSHEMASDPHPQHGSCPSIEAGLATLAPGQTRTTHAFANAGTCGYHDHLNDANRSLHGTIAIQ
jgi:plastocyanin